MCMPVPCFKVINGGVHAGNYLAFQEFPGSFFFLLVRKNVGLLDGLLGVAGMIIGSLPVDHSRKFPAFSTSKFLGILGMG